jgi:hypothetical protein
MVALVPPEYVFRTGFEPEPDPPGWVDGALTDPVGQACAMCGTRDVAWVHPLDSEKTQFRMWDKRHTLASFWALCDRCEGLYQAGDDEALVGLMSGRSRYLDVEEEVRKPLAVFRAADRGARRLAEPPAEVVRLREQGFEPLHGYTGFADELGPAWPVDLRVELSAEVEPDEERRWFVRSPWPSISIPEVLALLYPVVMQRADNTELRPTDVREVLSWPEDRALAWLASRRIERAEAFD